MKLPYTSPEQAARSVVFGTAGHIDHGKTALVFALTGTDTDRLPEEKSRGITIDLGFAALRLEDERGRSLEISLIDVPGHHAFIRNMLAGTGGIDAVLLVIAADEGVKAQTIEHLAICGLLGIRHGVVVLTKKDAVDSARLEAATEQARRLLQYTFLETSRIVPVSARTREGIAELKTELHRLASQITARGIDLVPRLPIDRAFTMRGFGTVVTGTLQSGVLRTGDTLQIQPDGRSVRVRGVQLHGDARVEALGPCRVALNLAGVDVAEVQRGNTLTVADTLAPVSTLDAEVTMLAGAPLLKHRSRVSIHAFASDTLATVLLYQIPIHGGATAQPACVRLQLAKPLLLVPGDRFVIRQCSPAATIGGGRVLDAYPIPRLRKALAYRWLEQLKSGSPSQQLMLRVLRRGLAGISVRDLVAETGLTPEALQTLAKPLFLEGRVVEAGPKGAASQWIGGEPLTQAAERLLDHLACANAAGVSQAEVRSKTRLKDWVFELALERLLLARAIELQGDFLSLRGKSDQQAAGSTRLVEVEQIYLAAGLAPPIAGTISRALDIGDGELHGLITALIRAKKLVRLGADNLLLHREALEHLLTELKSHRGEHFDVARFKSFTGLTRKHAIPLLEHLDRARVTRNMNGTRIVL